MPFFKLKVFGILLDNINKNAGQGNNLEENNSPSFDYSFVSSIARIATYDDLRSAPRITTINPAKTNEFIEELTTSIYTQAQTMGGTIPYTVVREVTENFIHAQFKEIIVSILDGGNTIRFADQGPGIASKEQAQRPGFSSAIEPMKEYIRGVGSGLPIVKEYLAISNGSITIEDNLTAGSVITVSTLPQASPEPVKKEVPENFDAYQKQNESIALNQREKAFLYALLREGPLGVTDLRKLTGTPASTTYTTLTKLQKLGLVQYGSNQKRTLTEKGYEVAESSL